MSEIVKFENVSSGYGRIKVLNELSFEVQRGEIFGVIGPNGCGKTTMLNTLAGLIRPFSGSIIYGGRDISKLPPHRRCHMGIGRTFQIPRPFSGMTLLENVIVAASHGAGMKRREAAEWSEKCLETVGLADRKDETAGKLTLLDCKKLEVARALGTKSELLLLDEAAAGLTEAEVEEVMSMVLTLKKEGQTVVWIEHILDVMRNTADRLMCISEGSCLICGEPAEVISSPIVEEIYLGKADE